MPCLNLWSFLCFSFSEFTPELCLLSQSYRKEGNLDPINVSQGQNKRERTPVIWATTFSGVADTQTFYSSPCSAPPPPAGRRKPRYSGLCVHQHPRPWAEMRRPEIRSNGEAHREDTFIKCLSFWRMCWESSASSPIQLSEFPAMLSLRKFQVFSCPLYRRSSLNSQMSQMFPYTSTPHLRLP